MTLRLSRGEFWLLANAVDHGLSLPMLTLPQWTPGMTGIRSTDTLDVVLNRQAHGLAVPSLVEALLQLSRSGWVEFGRQGGERIGRPSADELRAFLDEPGKFFNGVYYSLTPDGGAAWESFAHPEWSLFIEHESQSFDEDEDDVQTTTVRTCDWKRLGKYLEAVAREEAIEPGTMTLAELRPWQATYWKTLPFGLECSFKSRERRSPDCPERPWRIRERWCEWR